jgi:kelch-like protein 10
VADKSKELMDLDIEDFFQIVNDELLNVKDEQIVWECCIKWIDHDADKRINHLCRLLKAVRLGLLNKTVSSRP